LKSKIVEIARRMWRLLVSILIIQGLYFPVFAQKTSIKGVVTDTSGSPIPFATIVIKDTSIGTLSDEAGSFTLNGLSSEKNTIHVQCIGYETMALNVMSKEASSGKLRIKLKPSAIKMDEVVVTGKSESFKIAIC
jgi:hypothetical protein